MTTIRSVIPYAPKEKITGSAADIVDRTGSAIFEFVKHAGNETDLLEARDVAHKLADELRATRDQLRTAHDQINALKADVGHYQHRANRAEKWLHQISSEIEQRSSLRTNDGHSAGRSPGRGRARNDIDTKEEQPGKGVESVCGPGRLGAEGLGGFRLTARCGNGASSHGLKPPQDGGSAQRRSGEG